MSWRRFLLVAARMRTSILTKTSPPTGLISRSWITRKSLFCTSGATSPISSRNSVPPEASRKRPRRARCAPVAERARHRGAQLLARRGLAHVVERALAHRLDRVLDGRLPGEHDEWDVDVALARPLHQLDPRRPRRHVHVGEHDVVGHLLER